MRVSARQYALRLTCGLGLLLVPAVQQKLCAWPAARQRVAHQQPAPQPAPKESQKKKSAPLTLAALVPDVAPPRWPNHTHLWEAQRAEPLPTSTWTPATPDHDRELPDSACADTFVGRGRLPAPELVTNDVHSPEWLSCLRARLFRTAVQRTGPPLA